MGVGCTAPALYPPSHGSYSSSSYRTHSVRTVNIVFSYQTGDACQSAQPCKSIAARDSEGLFGPVGPLGSIRQLR